jgi:serine/threonine protein phosphatase PrpC
MATYLFAMLAFVLLLVLVFLVAWAVRKYWSTAPYSQHRVAGVSHPYGIYESIGRRPTMEDRHVVLPLHGCEGLYGHPSGEGAVLPPTLFGVFDGHAGSAAAEFCSSRLGSVLMNDASWPSSPEKALTNAFHVLDASFLELASSIRPPLNDGTTAVAALTLGGRLLVANAGDSRAVLVQRDGSAHALSEDHKPERPDERKRILGLGGTVYFHGVWRVEGVLAVSRAIGDRGLKPYVSSTPELRWWDCTPSDAALVIACDGLWDVLSNAQVAEVVLAAMHPLPDKEEPHEAAQRASAALVRQAIIKGSLDNVTCLVVDLRRDHLSRHRAEA